LYALKVTAPGNECVEVHATRALDTTRYVTARGRHGLTTLYGGWSGAEEDYVWTDGRRAALGVPVPQGTRFEVDLRFMVYRPDLSRSKTIILRTRRGGERHRIEVAAGEAPPAAVTLRFGPDDVEPDRTIFLEVLLPDAESPSAHGADDPRDLGIALYEYTVRVAD
jgi:hypothetical protein